MFVIINFSMAVMLIVAVNCNIDVQCGYKMKAWLVSYAMILGLGSLIAAIGLDIERQPRLLRRVHNWCKLAQYFSSVGWLVYGNYLAFIDGNTCPREMPVLSMTLMVTLFFGWIHLVMFLVFIGGLLLWALIKCCGREPSFSPESLWRDQQQFYDRDPEYTVNQENREILG